MMKFLFTAAVIYLAYHLFFKKRKAIEEPDSPDIEDDEFVDYDEVK